MFKSGELKAIGRYADQQGLPPGSYLVVGDGWYLPNGKKAPPAKTKGRLS